MHLEVLLQIPMTKRGPGYTCGKLAQAMTTADFSVNITAPRATGLNISPASVHQVLPIWARYVPYRWVKSISERRIEQEYLARFDELDPTNSAAYIFPDAATDTLISLHDDRRTIFREMISCHRASAKVILDNAYEAIGESPAHTITAASIPVEVANLEVTDFIFSAHPLVDSSLIENGVPAAKILKASYGWDPARLSGTSRLLDPTDGITAVFAGSVSVGKGVHLLLQYWVESKVRGRLILAGLIEPLIREKYSKYLARADVVELGYVEDIGALFRSADLFLFPSLVEGGPQVTYEALACGVPVITSPMGAGRVARHDIEGYVVEPYDRDGWVDSIQRLASDSVQREKFSEAARERAREFTWDAVAARRRQQVMDSFAGRSVVSRRATEQPSA